MTQLVAKDFVTHSAVTALGNTVRASLDKQSDMTKKHLLFRTVATSFPRMSMSTNSTGLRQ